MALTSEAYKQSEDDRQRQMELALLLAALVDSAVADFDRLVILMGVEVQTLESEAIIKEIVADYLGQIGVSIAGAKESIVQGGVEGMARMYGLQPVDVTGEAGISHLAETLSEIVESRIGDAQNIAELAAFAAEGSPIATLQSILSAPGLQGQLHKAADFAYASMGQAGLFLAGRGQAPRKIAVPVLDNRTTNLCRNRMAWQVRAWEDYFVDPVSGSRWLTPPFIYGHLSRKEAFHYCRTSIAPII